MGASEAFGSPIRTKLSNTLHHHVEANVLYGNQMRPYGPGRKWSLSTCRSSERIVHTVSPSECIQDTPLSHTGSSYYSPNLTHGVPRALMGLWSPIMRPCEASLGPLAMTAQGPCKF